MANNATEIEYFSRERQNVIQKLALQSQKNHGFPHPTTEQTILLHRLGLLLTRLDQDVKVTPTFKQKTKIDEGLKLMFEKPNYHFPKEHSNKARALFEKWQDENWGASPSVKDEEIAIKIESGSEAEMSEVPHPKRRKTSGLGKSRKQSMAEDNDDSRPLRLPPVNHEIWGVNGIMHGIAYKKGEKKVRVLDPRYQKRDAAVFGHNKLRNGDWFAGHLPALFRGAHGTSMAGIAGSRETGAYSIVVSGLYDDLDQDHGNILFYSGSGSHNNTDPHAPAKSTSGTLALHKSLETQKPVRVLRSDSGKSKYAPTCGYRYDGLYRVESVNYPKNGKGGLYEQFKLVRLEGQSDIDIRRPTPTEQWHFGRIGVGFRKS